MKYRQLGSTGKNISVLSLGCMRFPDKDTAAAIVARSVELGINYFETSNRYCRSSSEEWLAGGLGADRAKVMVSTKCQPGAGAERKNADTVRRTIEESLRKLGTDYVDFYHAWTVNNEAQYESCTCKDGWLEGVTKARDEGLVRHIGITTHATPKLIMEMVKDGRWEVITVQYSLILQSYRDVIGAAHKKNIGIVIMGPLAGGLLVQKSDLLEKVYAPDDQLVGSMKYVLADPAVSSIASGMRSVKEVEQNCSIIDAMPADISLDHQTAINTKLRAELGGELERFEKLLCGGCRYCMNACPVGIGPHNLFKAYNMTMLKAELKDCDKLAHHAAELRQKCILCGKCVEACPQKINVPEHLDRVREYFEQRAAEAAATKGL
jgi:predicted aldo/keto reductase-like oxidoreductase